MKCAAAVLVLVLVHVLDSAAQESIGENTSMRHKIAGLMAANCDTWAPAIPCEEEGWIRLNSNTCIKLFDEPETFDEAQQSCSEDGGGNLVSIHNLKEYNTVMCMIIRAEGDDMMQVWIGLREEEGSSTFSFTDGTQVQYEKWLPGSTDQDGKCVQMNYAIPGHWSPLDCSEELPYICEKEM